MKRYQSYLIFLVFLIILYLGAFFYINTSQGELQLTQLLSGNITHLTFIKNIFKVLPWYTLICVGSYCLGRLGLDILKFNDCPQEIAKLGKVNFI